jgi:cobalt-zinc-cadmium efflux system outer membrane protein
MRFKTRLAAMAASLGLLAACGTVPLQSTRQQAQALLQPSAGALSPTLTAAAAAERELRALLAAPLDVSGAVRIAWLRNADAQADYARLGIAAADVFAASRPANPQLGLSLLWPTRRGGDRKLDGSLGFGFSDLLWLHARRRYGALELRSAQQQLAAQLYALALDTEEAWFDAVASQQRLAVRRTIAASARLSAELAEQYRLAGNINALEASLQGAAGAEADIAASQAAREASRSRSRLRQLLGLTATDPLLQLPANLPFAEAVAFDADTLHVQARSQRLDLAAARSDVQALSLRLATTHRYRLLGGGEIGAVAEREGSTNRRAGLSAALELPLFSQGQPAVARAESELQLAQARVRQIEVAIDAEVDSQLEQLALAREQYTQYREKLIPLREAAVARLSEQANFMLIGPFELLLARQQSYTAYEGAVDALQSWWQGRIALTRALGAPLLAPAKEN